MTFTEKYDKIIVGSLKYIAPEILNKEDRNHKVDLYSFGVLLYRILFKKYPFDSDTPLEIYKSQIKGNIDFPETTIPTKYVEVVKKLLQKNANDRFETSLNLLGNLGINLPEDYQDTWHSAKVFIGRKDIIGLINNYIYDVEDLKQIRILGESKSGKSFLLNEIQYLHENCILISKNGFNKNIPFEDQMLYSIVKNQNIFPKVPEKIKERIQKFLSFPEERVIDDYRIIFSGVSKSAKFILLVDEISNFDSIEIELLTQILPILIVNGTKIILAGKTDSSLTGYILPNSNIIELKPFIESEVEEFINMNFAYFFPLSDIKEVILKYSDLQPGNIERFIDGLVHNKILQFNTIKPVFFKMNSETEVFLKSSHSEIYSYQYSRLSKNEKEILKHISLIRIPLKKESIKSLIDLPSEVIDNSLQTLEKKNILVHSFPDNKYEFYSLGNKNFVASKIANLKLYHLKIANWLISIGDERNAYETAYHFEIACKYENCFKYYYLEINRAKKLSTYNYIIEILNHLLNLPISDKMLIKVKIDLSEAYFQQGDINNCYSITEENLNGLITDEERIHLLIQKGFVLIRLGEFQKGIDTLESILTKISDSQKQNEILNEIADAYLYLNNFDKTISICSEVISNDKSNLNNMGKAFNLLGLVELYGNNDPNKAIDNFKKAVEYYKRANMTHRVSAMMINIGNIYVMMNDYKNGQKVWDEASVLNKSIGNLEQEGKLLLNYGILNFDMCEFEKAYEQYVKSKNIFENLGDKNSVCLSLINIGEVSCLMCWFSEAHNSLTQAKHILEEIKNNTELAEALFLSAKLSYILGDYGSLLRTIEKFSSLLNQDLISQTSGIKLKLLKSLLLILENKPDEAQKLLMECIQAFALTDEREDNYNFAFSTLELVNISAELGKYSEARKLLCNEKFIKITEQNLLIAAEKDFWLGKLEFSDKTKDAFENIKSALSGIENLCITSLSWRVTYLAGLYFEGRGNVSRAEKYFHLTEALLLKIEEYCSTENISKLFNNIPEVKVIRNNINKFNQNFTLH